MEYPNVSIDTLSNNNIRGFLLSSYWNSPRSASQSSDQFIVRIVPFSNPFLTLYDMCNLGTFFLTSPRKTTAS